MLFSFISWGYFPPKLSTGRLRRRCNRKITTWRRLILFETLLCKRVTPEICWNLKAACLSRISDLFSSKVMADFYRSNSNDCCEPNGGFHVKFSRISVFEGESILTEIGKSSISRRLFLFVKLFWLLKVLSILLSRSKELIFQGPKWRVCTFLVFFKNVVSD